jgi:hypothetical protein
MRQRRSGGEDAVSGEGHHNIDEIPNEGAQLRPIVRLAHLLLRECLDGSFGELRLVSETGRAEVERGGAWQALMAFPPANYDALVGRFKRMAGMAEPSEIGRSATLRLRWRERDVSAVMTGHPATAGREDLAFRFTVGDARMAGIG